MRFLRDFSIPIKASAASIVLLVCLLGLGVNAYITSNTTAQGLRSLSHEVVEKQSAFSAISNEVVATHLKIFRYVSWSSNGVRGKALAELYTEILTDLQGLSTQIAALARRPDLSARERTELGHLVSEWADCSAKAKTTIELGQTDAAMATMMMSATDRSFDTVDAAFRRLYEGTTFAIQDLTKKLYDQSIRSKRIIVDVTVVGFLVSLLIAFLVGRSIVVPIQSITSVMQRLSAGETDVRIADRSRRDEIGRMIDSIEVFRETIIQKHAIEQALTEAIGAISEGFSLYDAEDRLIISNDRYRQLFSYSEDAIPTGTPFETIVRTAVDRGLIEEALPDRESWIRHRIAIHRNPGAPHLQHRSDGRWILVSERLTHDGGVVATYTDITELKEREAELADLVHQLEIARDAADEASRTKSSFLANMSHELRTPLNAIIGLTEMLEEDARDLGRDDEIEPLGRVQRAAQHLLALINDILDLSKIEAGKMELVLESFAISVMIEEVVQTVTPIAARNGNQIVVSCAPEIGSIYADRLRVQQSLMNLLSNASKFTSNGTITVSAARETSENGERVALAVTDTGIGMSPEQLSKLFQDFSQADSSTTRKYGGTGLGLAISRRFCQMMGGDISAESELGSGSRFVITLPVQVNERADAGKAPEPATMVSATPSPEPPLVLVIDDDPTMRDTLARYLQREGFRCVEADGGQDGLRLAHELRPNAITLDVVMPDLDGWAVLSAIKTDPLLTATPVVLITVAEERNRGFALGAVDYLVKPVNRDQLLRSLRQVSMPQSGIVLVIDDDALVRQPVRAALEQAGWRVAEADDGETALSLLDAVRPNVILLDLMMPHMDGFGFLQAIRQHEEWRDVPVIIITAHDLTADDRERLSGRVESVIQKRGQDDMLPLICAEVAKRLGRGMRQKAAAP